MDASIYLGAVDGITLRDCDIEPGAPFSVAAWTSVNDVAEFDLTGNYWGTTDSLQIEEWIFDFEDSDHPDYPPNVDLSRVRFMPVRDGSVPTERKSVGGLKGRFRGSRAVKN